MALDPICGERSIFGPLFPCTKQPEHKGERHTAKLPGGSFTWGHVPTDEEEQRVKHTIEIWESGSRGCWECSCGCSGSVSADGDVEIAAEKHVGDGDQVSYRYSGGDQ
jgi:hypothetical protein